MLISTNVKIIVCSLILGAFFLLMLISMPGYAQEPTTPFPTSVYVDYPLMQESAGITSFFLRCVAWSPDGKTLAVGTSTGLRLYDEDFQLIADLTGQYAVTSVSWSPDGKYVATSALDHTIWIWDAENFAAVRVFADHETPVKQVIWNPNGEYLASGDILGWVFIWDIATGQVIREIPPLKGKSTEVYGLDWHPNGILLAYNQGFDYFVWDFLSDQIIWHKQAHRDTITALAWSPDGEWLVTSDGATPVFNQDGSGFILLISFR